MHAFFCRIRLHKVGILGCLLLLLEGCGSLPFPPFSLPAPIDVVGYPNPHVRAIAEFSNPDGWRYTVLGTKTADGYPESIDTIVVTLPDGQEASCEYDNNRRLTRMAMPEGQTVHLAWDDEQGGIAHFNTSDGWELASLPFQAGGGGLTASKPVSIQKSIPSLRGLSDPRTDDVYDTIQVVCANGGEPISNVAMTVSAYCGERRVDYWVFPSSGTSQIRRPRSLPSGEAPQWAEAMQGALDALANVPDITFESACVPFIATIPYININPVIFCQFLQLSAACASDWEIVRGFFQPQSVDCSTITYRVHVMRAPTSPWIAWEADQSNWSFTVDEDAPATRFGIVANCPLAFLVVHVHNPEGVEIASIQGMRIDSVALYDCDKLIGYGAYSVDTHNRPIEIPAGTHTIKAEFNGMLLEQNVDLVEGKTQVITFIFTETVFDLAGWLDGLSYSANLSVDEVFNIAYGFHQTGPGWRVEAVQNGPPLPDGWATIDGVAQVGYVGDSAILEGHFSAALDLSFNSTGFNLVSSTHCEITKMEDCSPYYSGASICASWATGWTGEHLHNIPSPTSFTRWYIQYEGCGYCPIVLAEDVHGGAGFVFLGWEGYTEHPYYHIDSYGPSQFSTYPYFSIQNRCAEGDYPDDIPVTSISSPPDNQVNIHGTITGLRMSSIPYDLLGSGVR